MVTERNPIVYLDIQIGAEKVGRVILELNKKLCPETVENFRALCTGEKGIGTMGKPLHYKGCIFHKTVSQFMIQGGDITHFDGTGGESIYGPSFNDENFTLKNNLGVVGMANGGPNSNNSQFFITTVPCPHLNNTNVVFGVVKAGSGVVAEVSTTKTDSKDHPLKECKVVDCGELKPDEDWGICENDGTEDIFPPFPEDWACPQPSLNCYESVIEKIKTSGNYFFKVNNYIDADRKYRKALRYIEWTETKCKDAAVNDLKTTKITCILNLCAVYLKMNLFRDALNRSNEVLNIDKNCAKAFYRRGQAKVRLNDYEAALKDFRTAQAIVPNDKRIKIEIKSLRQIIKNYLLIEKETYEKMFKRNKCTIK